MTHNILGSGAGLQLPTRKCMPRNEAVVTDGCFEHAQARGKACCQTHDSVPRPSLVGSFITCMFLKGKAGQACIYEHQTTLAGQHTNMFRRPSASAQQSIWGRLARMVDNKPFWPTQLILTLSSGSI